LRDTVGDALERWKELQAAGLLAAPGLAASNG
jgi:hypothetical protein